MANTDVPNIGLNDGNTIPAIGLGVWRAENGQETQNAVKVALETGYRLIDTAAIYQNEESVGRAVAESGISREEIFITTKLWNSDQGAKNVRPALAASLKKLGLDYIDLYLIHWPTPARDLFTETWEEFEVLKGEGLIKSIGVSNFRVEDLEHLKKAGLTTPAVNQIELHPGLIQTALRDYAKENGIHIESWSPIGGSKGNLLENTELKRIADNHGKSPAQVVIRWHLQNELIVIPKSVHDERIKQNFNIFDFELSEDEVSTISSIESGGRQGPDPSTMNIH